MTAFTSSTHLPLREVPVPAPCRIASGRSDAAPAALLAQLMPLVGLALWQAWSDPLELIAFSAGPTANRHFPLDPAQLQPGTPWDDSVYPPDRDRVHAFLAGSQLPAAAIEYRLIVGEGELLWVRHWLLSRSAPSPRGRRRLLGFLMAIPEQKHLEWECLRVSERECNRIGQELHDDLCQVLAGLAFMVNVLGQRIARAAPELRSDVDELGAELHGATDRVRAMAHGLFPAQLRSATLRHALGEFARQARTRFGVEVTLDLPRSVPPHSPEQIIHVFRIAQEAVANAVRHGRAGTIRIAVASTRRQIRMSVGDNGTGLPASSARPEGIGMHTMQYRARVLGGELRFHNRAPKGAVVELTYPLGRGSSRRAPNRNQCV